MNGPDHYRVAERLLELCLKVGGRRLLQRLVSMVGFRCQDDWLGSPVPSAVSGAGASRMLTGQFWEWSCRWGRE